MSAVVSMHRKPFSADVYWQWACKGCRILVVDVEATVRSEAIIHNLENHGGVEA